VPNILLPIPHQLQRSEGDCLAACAAMALAYWDVASDYDHLLRLLEVKSYGAPGSRLNKLVSLGVQVRYAQGALDELFDYLTAKQPYRVGSHRSFILLDLRYQPCGVSRWF
jgi:ABC-type bacteriocin/lantibiotic exporter with double-glycine peptidase domain